MYVQKLWKEESTLSNVHTVYFLWKLFTNWRRYIKNQSSCFIRHTPGARRLPGGLQWRKSADKHKPT